MKYQKRDLAVHFEQSSKPKRSKYIIQRKRERYRAVERDGWRAMLTA